MLPRATPLLILALVLVGCGGGDSGGGGGGGGAIPTTGSISGTVTPFYTYPMVTGAESADSTVASPLQVAGPKSGELLFVIGTLSSSSADTTDRVTFVEGNAAVYNVKISWLGGVAIDCDLLVRRFDGVSTTTLLTLNGTTNPESGNINVTGGVGALIIFDLALFSGTATQWRLDVTVLSGSPSSVQPPEPDYPKSEIDPMDVALAGHDAVPDRLLVTFEAETTLEARQDLLVRFGLVGRRTLTCGAIVAERITQQLPGSLHSSLAHLKELANLSSLLSAQPEVKVAEPDFLCSPCLIPNDPHYNAYQTWHYSAINLPAAWNITTGSTAVIVAVVDTGVVLSHPDFAGRLIPGYDFISNPAMALDSNGIDSNPDDPGDNPGQGSTFHGTHVAGTIGAATNNGVGVAGVDWNCKIMPIRVLGAGGGSNSDIAEGILFAARLTNASGTFPANRAHVINMSLGGPGLTSVMANAITAASNAGCVLVAAAGNNFEQGNQINYPAAYPEVIAVGAINRNYQRANYSCTSSGTNVCAPGGQVTAPFSTQDGVFSTWRDDVPAAPVNKYQWLQGTSMAAPHVAGVVALMYAVNPALTPANVLNILTSTALDLGTAGYDVEYGSGLIRAEAALVAAGGTLPANPPTAAVTNQVVLVPQGASVAYSGIVNIGGGTLTVSSPQANHFGTENWLNVTLLPNGSQVLMVLTINRAQIAAGSLYYAAATVSTNDPTQPTVVVAVLLNELTPRPVTYSIRLRAVNVDTGQPANDVFTNAASSFNYSLTNLLPGNYVVSGFVDNDSSTTLSDGDYVGLFPSLSVPSQVGVVAGANTVSINFPLERHSIGILAVGGAVVSP